MRRIYIEKGTRFGKLTAIGYAGKNEKNKRTWMCRCDCGNTAIIPATMLVHGNRKSCGCLGYKGEANGMYKHGDSETRLHKIWELMKYRCTNPNATNFKNYGGRGIKVCDEWRDNYIAFKEWAEANGYKDTLSIDRIDNDGDYSPQNCRWATCKEQVQNRRNSIRITYNGQTKSLSEWAEELGIKYGTLYSRYKKGWPNKDILRTQVL